MVRRVAVATDHAGVAYKNNMVTQLKDMGYEVKDCGAHDEQSVDYPDFAKLVAREVLSMEDTLGLLICGTGIGMSIAANKCKGIRAALCHSEYEAQMARNHNDANIICIGARTMELETARRVVAKFLESEFEGGRHARRVDKMMAFEG